MIMWILLTITVIPLITIIVLSKRHYDAVFQGSIDRLTLIYANLGLLCYLIPLKVSMHQHVYRAFYVPAAILMILAIIQNRSNKAG